MINDRTGAAQVLPEPLAGDRATQWIRLLHEGRRGGIVRQWLVFLTGVFPPIFAVTGIVWGCGGDDDGDPTSIKPRRKPAPCRRRNRARNVDWRFRQVNVSEVQWNGECVVA
jgi:PepSY-associated TM region